SAVPEKYRRIRGIESENPGVLPVHCDVAAVGRLFPRSWMLNRVALRLTVLVELDPLAVIPPDHALGAVEAERVEQLLHGHCLLRTEAAPFSADGHHSIVRRDFVVFRRAGLEMTVGNR